MTKPELPVIAFASQTAFDAFLTQQPADSPGLWLKFAKPSANVPSIAKREAIETAIRHGWIDGQLASVDADWWLTRFTPRGSWSRWSKINRETAQRLIEAGAMLPAGLREVEHAKADGRWDAAYASQSKMEMPDDLRQALEAHPRARDFFATISSANRYAVLYRLHVAKKPETRTRLIEKFVVMLDEHRTIHP